MRDGVKEAWERNLARAECRVVKRAGLSRENKPFGRGASPRPPVYLRNGEADCQKVSHSSGCAGSFGLCFTSCVAEMEHVPKCLWLGDGTCAQRACCARGDFG